MGDDHDIQPIFTISQISEENHILNSIENNELSSQCESSQNFQEQWNIEYVSSRHMSLYSMEYFGNSSTKIFPGNTLNVNKNMEEFQKKKLMETLQKNYFAYAWAYINMKGINPKTCMHHIYIE